MKTSNCLVIMPALALTLPVATMIVFAQAGRGVPSRPGDPVTSMSSMAIPAWATHSFTGALHASCNGPVYQVMRQSDGRTLDFGVIPTQFG